MAKGESYACESREFRDEKTGARLRQVTNHPSVHHHPFYYVPAWDDAMSRLVFVSHRTGRPEIFAEIQDTRRLLQLTELEDIAEWSIHPSHDGEYVYFTAGAGAWRVDAETLKVEELINFGDIETRAKGMIGAALRGMGLMAIRYCIG